MIVRAAPALPLHTAGKYVAAAYIVFVVLLLVYLAIMARRLRTTERDLNELSRELAARNAGRQVAAVPESAGTAERDREPVA